VYNNEVTYQAYYVDLQEINLRSGKVLKYPPLTTKPIENSILEKEDTSPQKPPLPQQTPPYPERITTKKTYTSVENELLGKLRVYVSKYHSYKPSRMFPFTINSSKKMFEEA
jgi:hypothetical protein